MQKYTKVGVESLYVVVWNPAHAKLICMANKQKLYIKHNYFGKMFARVYKFSWNMSINVDYPWGNYFMSNGQNNSKAYLNLEVT